MLDRLDRSLYLRNVIFGITDSLVSTVGLLSGIGASGATGHTVILTGIVYAFVESFSMAVGSFLSEAAGEDYALKKDAPYGRPFVGGLVMFASFILASFIPIGPYLFLNASSALFASIGVSIAALFLVGYVSARLSKTSVLRHGARMALLGGFAIVIGVIVGRFADGI